MSIVGLKGIKGISKLDVNAVLVDVLTGNIEKVKNVSREQLARGETPSGARLPKYRNRDYLRRKGTPKTAPGGRMNLNLQGKFYQGITPKIATTAITWPAGQQEKKYPFLVKHSNTGTLLAWNDRSIQTAKQTFLLRDFAREMKRQIFN